MTERSIQLHLEASQNISMLNEYCQKSSKTLPEWRPLSTPTSGGSLAYSHGMILVIDGQTFECNGASTRNDAKKICASAAVEYFESNGIPYFTQRLKSYVALCFLLSQAASILPPDFQVNNEGIGFAAICSFFGEDYHSEEVYAKKTAAKEDAAKVAFESVCKQGAIIQKVFIGNPSYSAKVTRNAMISVQTVQAPQPLQPSPIGPLRPFQPSNKHTFFEEKESVILGAPPMDYKKLIDAVEGFEKPYFNYRVVNEGGSVLHKAQLIMGPYTTVSSNHQIKFDAVNEVSKAVYEMLVKDKIVTEKRKIDDLENERRLREYCKSVGNPLPTICLKESPMGWYCIGSILLPHESTKVLEIRTLIVEGESKDFIREKLCADLLAESNSLN